MNVGTLVWSLECDTRPWTFSMETTMANLCVFSGSSFEDVYGRPCYFTMFSEMKEEIEV